jgi:hypothetical protein
VLANHERFTDDMLKNWHYEGPERGVGSKARVKAVAAGRTDTVDIEVIEAEAPVRTMERNVGAGGRRIATGTYILAPFPTAPPASPSSTPGARRRGANDWPRPWSGPSCAAVTSVRCSASLMRSETAQQVTSARRGHRSRATSRSPYENAYLARWRDTGRAGGEAR